jgi:3-methyladenine DNA glycosylase AlkD
MTAAEILSVLQATGSTKVRASMQRFGIDVANAQGISTPELKRLARSIGRDHELAQKLWASGVFEARALAALIDEPARVTAAQMERWARDLNSWAICDACCCYLFRLTPFAWKKAVAWSKRKAEFTKRAGFSLIAYLAVHDRNAPDREFENQLPVIERESADERHFVTKAVNWALRQIGKRNLRLNKKAIATAERIRASGTPPGRWIAADALRELRSEAVRARLRRVRD